MKQKKINVTLAGLSPIMFDRFYDHSQEDRPPEKKLYLNEQNEAVLPAENIYSFLFRDMPPVGIVRHLERKGAKDYIAIGQACIAIDPILIPFHDVKGRPIKFTGFGSGSPFQINDWSSGITKMSGGKAIKQEIKKRPYLVLPWQLSFCIDYILPNEKVTPEKLHSYFAEGGIVTALGSYRPRHGRFEILKWDVK